MSIHILGIRHHGPGSARSVKKALQQLQPDIILVEGPPDADVMLHYIGQEGMEPPVALLAYMPDDPQQAVFYPFAQFSPEWQAIAYAQQAAIPVRFMDLPLTHSMAMDKGEKDTPLVDQPADIEEILPSQAETEISHEDFSAKEELETGLIDTPVEHIHRDPLKYLAEAAGYQESELWWEHTFEQRQNTEESFAAIMESMQALREALPETKNKKEPLREAYMRKIIRSAQKEGFLNIAVICGAWHAPALTNLDTKKADEELLKKLPKTKVDFTWIPWTYSRLTFDSGYGAGIHSPGWYQHLWDFPQDTAVSWLAKVAALFRQKNMDTSVAHVIEAVRLADMLALLRNYPRPGLHELNEATQSVICFGDEVLLQLIRDELIVSNKLGQVPGNAPKVPLQHDFEKQQSKCRLQPKADDKVYVLDLRQPTDLDRSKLLHRLSLLDIKWGRQENVSGKGTFKEQWRLRWQPELLIKVIEMGVWGNTIEEATNQFIAHQSKEVQELSKVARLLERTIPAELPGAVDAVMNRINELASMAGDIVQLMQALPPLAYVSRYGNVRKTDLAMLSALVDSLIVRICVGLPNACYSLDEDASASMFAHISEVNNAINLLQQDAQLDLWHHTLLELSAKEHIHGLISGCACRILFDGKALPTEEMASRFSLALSTANEPGYSAAWLEGFLKSSGMILLLDDVLWNILYQWVATLDGEVFKNLLPLLRRTFSTFSPVERRKMGEKAKGLPAGQSTGFAYKHTPGFDASRAEQALPVVKMLLGM
ncbi:DUF5682 family protein [Rhodocytophaga aerolata]|uniref:DUF5682 family protein n=1 Tax=Rhodocytophaga aerolata TaxID=455078 RepID=A0ABT8RA74_9BACT|nr:DUF5682 family protein [Rhodocytophaga aerolata]MDO1449001.1 DUF5682 family protein [Rhodocytophaga aerolata]